uniref:Putative phosphatidylinositol N-acetylglucosaminyltransferase subunit C n=1 Tax=Lygus hesperus TaxID=30085 RepID=A0A0A9X340_LYGHE
MSLHIFTADYSYLNGYTSKYHPNLSINAATFGVILMASRIQSALKSGELFAFGTICFSISPIARHDLKRYSFSGHAVVTCFLFMLASLCLIQIPILAIPFVLICALITFIFPLFFV